jgi:hypothetical protein
METVNQNYDWKELEELMNYADCSLPDKKPKAKQVYKRKWRDIERMKEDQRLDRELKAYNEYGDWA